MLVGNSLGSLIALNVATGYFSFDDGQDLSLKKYVNGIFMFNCGIGVNSKGVAP